MLTKFREMLSARFKNGPMQKRRLKFAPRVRQGEVGFPSNVFSRVALAARCQGSLGDTMTRPGGAVSIKSRESGDA